MCEQCQYYEQVIAKLQHQFERMTALADKAQARADELLEKWSKSVKEQRQALMNLAAAHREIRRLRDMRMGEAVGVVN